MNRFPFWQSLLLATAACFLILASQVHAAETILLQYRDLTLTIPQVELQNFTKTGTLSAVLQRFFQESQQDPATIRDYLTTPISVQKTPLISDEFALIEIHKAIGEPFGRQHLEPLKAAFKKATKANGSVSMMDVLAAYPAATVRLSLDQLVPVYRDVELFLTRIRPVLSVAKQLLPELVCDCEHSAATPHASPLASSLSPADQDRLSPKSVHSSIAYTQFGNSIKSLFSEEADLSPQSVTSPQLEHVNPVLPIAARTYQASALPNQKLIIEFGPLRPAISLAELTTFVETGALSRNWRFYLKVAKIKPENLQAALAQEINVEAQFLDKTLNSLLGEYLLYQVSQIIHTPFEVASIQALRSALVQSALEDNRITFLDLLKHYPTSEMYLNGERLARLGQIASRVAATGGLATAAVNLEDWLVEVQASIAQQICTCAADQPHPTSITPLQIDPETVAQYLPSGWKPVPAHRTDIGSIKVVWLQRPHPGNHDCPKCTK